MTGYTIGGWFIIVLVLVIIILTFLLPVWFYLGRRARVPAPANAQHSNNPNPAPPQGGAGTAQTTVTHTTTSHSLSSWRTAGKWTKRILLSLLLVIGMFMLYRIGTQTTWYKSWLAGEVVETQPASPDTVVPTPAPTTSPSDSAWYVTPLDIFNDYGWIVGAVALLILIWVLLVKKPMYGLALLALLAAFMLLLEPRALLKMRSDINRLVMADSNPVVATGAPIRIGTFIVGETPVSIPQQDGYCVRPSGERSGEIKATTQSNEFIAYFIATVPEEVKLDFYWYPLDSNNCR